MPINEQSARISNHTSTTTGSFTVPSSEDFTDGTWDKWDLAKSEIGVNEADDTVSIRVGANIKDIRIGAQPTNVAIACSDETTALAVATGVATFRMPYAMTVTEVRASLTTAPTTSGLFTVDINEGGTSILSTKITIDLTEKTSTTAATLPVISDSALADDAEITIDIDAISGGGTEAGLKIYLIGTIA